MPDRELTVAEITQDKIDLLEACERAATICGLMQRLLDAAVKKAKYTNVHDKETQ